MSEAYRQRVEGSGDFAERLEALVERIVARYEGGGTESGSDLSSSRILEVVYGREIHPLRDEVLGYLRSKGLVFFLFDNLDRFWTVPSFSEADALIVTGLIESLTDIRRRFAQIKLDFLWAVFLRSDVFEFVVRRISDYGKLSVDSVEWHDPELLIRLFQNRILQGFQGAHDNWRDIWESVSVQQIGGQSTIDFLVESSLMRPRYLIRLFETARRRAITLGKSIIEEDDYRAAIDELGWQVLEDFDRELLDVVPNVEELMFDLVQIGPRMSLSELQRTIGEKGHKAATIDTIIDVLIWTGCIGIQWKDGIMYISDCGFKRPFMRSLLHDANAEVIVFHPTLAAIIEQSR